MARHAKTIIEYRCYDLPPHFPILLLSGDIWHISDIPSGVLHFHNCLEIGLCESDNGTLVFQDRLLHFAAGDITVISSDMPHSTYSAPGTASKWAYLFVDPEELLRPFFPLDMLPNSDLFRSVLHGYRNILSRGRFPALYELAWQVVNEMHTKQLNYEISVRGLFLALMTELMRVCSAVPADDAAGKDQGAFPIVPALEYISEHYMDDFPMDVLAKVCHMSSSHFRRVFGQIMGTGPLEHLIRMRVSKACTLLRMTEDSILHISEQVGFHSLSSFNRHFSAMIGEPPSLWRRHMNANQNVSILKYTGWLVPPPSA